MGLWLGMSVMTLLQFVEFAMIAVCTHGGTGAVAVLIPSTQSLNNSTLNLSLELISLRTGVWVKIRP